MAPGQVINGGPAGCTWFAADTDDVWAQVDVVGLKPDGSQFWLGDVWYNSDVSGIGIGAEGTPSSFSIETW